MWSTYSFREFDEDTDTPNSVLRVSVRPTAQSLTIVSIYAKTDIRE